MGRFGEAFWDAFVHFSAGGFAAAALGADIPWWSLLVAIGFALLAATLRVHFRE